MTFRLNLSVVTTTIPKASVVPLLAYSLDCSDSQALVPDFPATIGHFYKTVQRLPWHQQEIQIDLPLSPIPVTLDRSRSGVLRMLWSVCPGTWSNKGSGSRPSW